MEDILKNIHRSGSPEFIACYKRVEAYMGYMIKEYGQPIPRPQSGRAPGWIKLWWRHAKMEVRLEFPLNEKRPFWCYITDYEDLWAKPIELSDPDYRIVGASLVEWAQKAL